MKLYRVIWGGYGVYEAESEGEAKKQFIDYIEEENIDVYGRTWKDLIEIEELEE